MYTGIQKQKYYWADISLSLKIKVKGEDIAIFYTVLSY